MNQSKPYELQIDGPLFRYQRGLLGRILDAVRQENPYVPRQHDIELLEGLVGLTDAIADQAHDRHGIACLLDDEDDNRCECEKPGHFYSGVPGILARVVGGVLEDGTKVERCDLCQRYPSDEAAFEKLRELGHVPP